MMRIMREDHAFSQDFHKNLDTLITYFDKNDPSRKIPYDPIPVFILRGDGYDYFLSNIGIELIVPDRPGIDRSQFMCIDTSDKELDLFGDRKNASAENMDKAQEREDELRRKIYNLYMVRQTGVYALLVPAEKTGLNYTRGDQLRTVRLNHADNNVEALIDNFFIDEVIEEITVHSDAVTGTIEPHELKEMKRRLNNAIEIALPKYHPACEGPYEFPEDYDIDNDYKDQLDPLNQALKCILLDALEPKRATTTRYSEELERIRDWFLSGSVFRRIANEMPRLKARLWLDCMNGRSQRRLQYVKNVGADALGNPDSNDRGCREIFEGILEVSLLDCDKMYFKGIDDPAGNCVTIDQPVKDVNPGNYT